MALNDKDVARIARLARIELTPEQRAHAQTGTERHPPPDRAAAVCRHARRRAAGPSAVGPRGHHPAPARGRRHRAQLGNPPPGTAGQRPGRPGRPVPGSQGHRVSHDETRPAHPIRGDRRPARGLAQRQVSAVDLAQSALAAADASGLNSFLHIDAELTLAQARAADAGLAAGTAGALAASPSPTRTPSSPAAGAPRPAARCWTATSARSTPPWSSACRRRRRVAGQAQLRRIRHGLGQRELRLRPGPEPLGHERRARWLLGRLGRRRGRPPGGRRHRHRHRRLGAPARRPVRRQRHQAHLRHRLAFRHGGLRLQPGPGRPAGRERPRPARAAGRHGGFDPRDATSLEKCDAAVNEPGRVRRLRRRPGPPRRRRQPAPEGPAHRRAGRVLRRRPGAGRGRRRGGRPGAVRGPGRRARAGVAAAHRAGHPRLLRHRPRRSVQQPGPLRRRALRSSDRRLQGSGGNDRAARAPKASATRSSAAS